MEARGHEMDDPNAPTTKRDLQELEQRLDQKLEQETRKLDEKIEMMRAESHHAYDDIKETFRDGQTELLKAFYSYARSTDAKLKESEVADMLLRERLTAVESRVTDIERRINTPPQAH